MRNVSMLLQETKRYSTTARLHEQFCREYQEYQGKAWMLSEDFSADELMYTHTLTLNKESCLHSFIIDTGNTPTIHAFKNPEHQKIIQTQNRKVAPQLPEWMKKELALYALPAVELEDALGGGWMHFPADHTGDEDLPSQATIKKFRIRLHRTIYGIWGVFQDEEQDLEQEQLEAFYAQKIWGVLVGVLFKNVPEIKVFRGEKCSLASALRRNAGRDLEVKKALGHRIDGIFASRKTKQEFAAIEAGKKDEGSSGTKLLTDARKLAKLLKDMLDHLVASTPYLGSRKEELELLGMLQSGLHVDFVSLDQVCGRFCRLNWERKFTVPCTLDDNGMYQILLLVKELLVFELRIAKVLQIVRECS